MKPVKNNIVDILSVGQVFRTLPHSEFNDIFIIDQTVKILKVTKEHVYYDYVGFLPDLGEPFSQTRESFLKGVVL